MRERRHERGVSEVISYVLVFSLITVSLATVSVVGIDTLQNTREAEQVENTERAFDVLAENIQDIHARDAPGRSTEIKLYQAQLGLGDPMTMTVEVLNVGVDTSYSTDISPIVYTSQNGRTKLFYSAGMLLRTDGNNAVRHGTPPMLFREDTEPAEPVRTVVIPFIQTRSSTSQSIGGTTTGHIRADYVLAETMARMTSPTSASSNPDGTGSNEYQVSYTIQTTTVRAPIWEAYLEEQIAWKGDACSASGGTVQCEFPVERLYVTATRINVEINA